MKLVYDNTQELVKVGDTVEVRGETLTVTYFRPPHKPSSQGKVSVSSGMEYYVSVIGAKWIEREDRENG